MRCLIRCPAGAVAALADPVWDATRGVPRRGGINGHVGAFLTAPAVLEALQEVFEGTG
jgi:hypothetical protein